MTDAQASTPFKLQSYERVGTFMTSAQRPPKTAAPSPLSRPFASLASLASLRLFVSLASLRLFASSPLRVLVCILLVTQF